MPAIKYSFNFRYERDIQREVLIPLDKLAGVNLLDGDLAHQISKLIDEDWELQHALFGSYLPKYEKMVEEYDIWEKDLQRYNEQAVLVPHEEAE